ncbi:MAG: 50S ribosomal protein L4, partial [Verrucomicrobia bacterium]|nr:50S ribosomal protein L4 [Verrucomicrobiota bacterium]
RAGYRQSPVWRGGAVAFGPHPRKVRKQLPHKVARLAFARAFGERATEAAITVVEDISLDAPKTKDIISLLKTLEINGKVLVIVSDVDQNISLAARNLQDVEVTTAALVNTYQVVRYPQVVVTKAAMEKLEERMA